ncbi:DUF1294 domain-containing protein [Pseudomonas akapageensis]|uniref:DUF1294 domain-containing protein n=1 Tax=Pseudomonas akapageensis TaxID=2609961 RepID=UPI003CCCDA09
MKSAGRPRTGNPNEAREASRQGAVTPVHNLRAKLLVLAGLCLLPMVGSLQMLGAGQSALPSLAYVLASLLTFYLYWHDKRQARGNAWRTPERVLHAAELCGGWPGALLAQQLFRHKTRKLPYQAKFWVIVTLHQLFWVDHLVFGGDWMGKALQPLLGT